MSAGKLSDLDCHRVHNKVVEDSLGKHTPPSAIGIGFGPEMPCVNSTTLTAERAISAPPWTARAWHRMSFDGLATALACNKDAGIEDQSDSEVARGFRLRMISSRSAANAASITGL